MKKFAWDEVEHTMKRLSEGAQIFEIAGELSRNRGSISSLLNRLYLRDQSANDEWAIWKWTEAEDAKFKKLWDDQRISIHGVASQMGCMVSTAKRRGLQRGFCDKITTTRQTPVDEQSAEWPADMPRFQDHPNPYFPGEYVVRI